MNQRLSVADTVGLGLMVFAFFFGAGNIIFPPLEGQHAGQSVLWAILGFLITAVGLPLIAIIAVARANGGLPTMTADLPKGTGTFVTVLLFIVIGPLFAAPRTGLVAYEMAARPLLGGSGQVIHISAFDLSLNADQMWITALFFVLTLLFAWSRGKLIDYIGKLLTPILFILLICLAIGVVVSPQGEVMPATENYQGVAFSKGFLGGYNTMDTFLSLSFGMLFIDLLRSKGVTEPKACARYLTIAGLIAAVGLVVVYIALFWLGATSALIAPGADNGGAILAAYVHALFGEPGKWILACVVLLACLTTAIGLLSACADYFSTLTPFSYRGWLIALCVISAVVANVGLSRLIVLSVPVLLLLYPLAIVLLALTFSRNWLANPRFSYRFVMLIALVFSLLDTVKATLETAGLKASDASGLLALHTQYVPLSDQGMGWVVPSAIAFAVVLCWPKSQKI